MKPFPEAVQRAFPMLGRLPERPWWCCVQHYEGQSRYRRMDDINRPRDSAAWIPLESLVFTIHPTADYAAKADSQNPIPHPGFRAGQIWAAEDGDSILLISCDDGEPYATGKWWPDGEFLRYYPYLVADLACPHLAPWSPVEGK